MIQEDNARENLSFVQRVWITTSIMALMVTVLLFLRATFGVLLLVLAATLIAVFFTGLSGLVRRKTRWNKGISLAVAVTVTVLLVAALFWLIGAKLQSQITELSETLPATLETAKAQLNKSSIGRQVVEKISSSQSVNRAKSILGTVFKSTFGVLGDVYVVLFMGIFFTVSPDVYTKGIVALIPQKGKKKGRDLLDKLNENLLKWLKGKFFAMFVVFVLTAVGLAILGIPLWLVLAIIAGLLNFIPNFGPIIAMVPAALVALLVSPTTAAIVAGMYLLIQVIESNFITPLVQQKLVSIPPALIIIAQLLISPLTGGWGLVLATPLMLILMTLIQELYTDKQK